VDPNYSIVQPVELGGAPLPRLLLKDVYRVYTDQFRRWFGITAPTSVLASMVLLMADQRIRAIYQGIPRGEIPYQMGKVAETVMLRYGSFLISWFLGCLALAAIATVANGLDKGDVKDVWISDSFQRAREHLGPLVLAAILTSGVFLAGVAVVEFAIFALAGEVGWTHFSRFIYGASFAGIVVVTSIVSWFGMGIPLILAQHIGAWAALKRSLKISNGYEAFLSLLVCESIVGSYVAWYAVHYGLTFFFPAQLRYTPWYGWLVYFVTILASAAVQPPMFIGFSLLAAAGPTNSSILPRAQQAAHIN
jgi:hypothetical protein